MTPTQLLAALERMKAVATSEPLRQGAVRATETAQSLARRSGKGRAYRVRSSPQGVTVTSSSGGLGPFKRAMRQQMPSVEADYRARIARAAKP